MLASQAAVALDNAQWSQGLEQKVAQRTEELQASNALLEQRANELAIINSIQEGMAAELDFQAIVDLVGDKLREVFSTGDIGIRWYDAKAEPDPLPVRVRAWRAAEPAADAAQPRRRRLRAIAGDAAAAGRRTPAPKQTALGDRTHARHRRRASRRSSCRSSAATACSGSIILENYERENAFGESEVRLLSTVAASMGVALENARLFDETQRLFKESEQRAAELADHQQRAAGHSRPSSTCRRSYDARRRQDPRDLPPADVGIRWYDSQTDI